MPSRPHPRRLATSHSERALIDAFARYARDHAAPWEGTGHRAASPRWASPETMVNGAGAAAYGGRWNRRGQHTVYASLDPVTPLKEASRQRAKFGFDPATCTTLVIMVMHADLHPKGHRGRTLSRVPTRATNPRRSPSTPRSSVAFQGQKPWELRRQFGLSQEDFGRLVGRSTRWVAANERREVPQRSSVAPRLRELSRLRAALLDVLQPAAVNDWLHAPNPGFGNAKPIELVERGETDRIWEAIYRAASGDPF